MPYSLVNPHIPLTFKPEYFVNELPLWVHWHRLPDDPLLVSILKNDLGAVIAHTLHDDGKTWYEVRVTQMWLWQYANHASGSPEAVRRWKA